MNDFILYFVKANIGFALFYCLYKLLFSKDTLLVARRIYLMSAIFVSILYPFLKLDSIFSKPQNMPLYIVDYIQSVQVSIIEVNQTVSYTEIIFIIYAIIAAVLFIRMITQLISIFRLRLLGTKKTIEDGTSVIIIDKDINPFSFFNWIFLNSSKHHQQALSEILVHEKTHVNQRHSVDILLSELLTVVCWINPFTWLLHTEIRQNLEFIADKSVLDAGHNSKSYQYHLLNLSSKNPANRFANNFYSLPLKKRIVMMNKQKTSKLAIVKYAFALPLISALLLVNNSRLIAAEFQQNENVKKEKVRDVNLKADEIVVVGYKSDKSKSNEIEDDKKANTPFDTVDERPEYPGGDNAMFKFIAENLKYPSVAAEGGVQGRVVIRFVINENGDITNPEVLKSLSAECDAEALRVINTMPKWKAGVKDGKNVSVYFTLPFMFKLTENNKEKKAIDIQTPTSNASKEKLAENILICVDGKEISKAELDQIDKDKIESVNVLKDKSATAKYGEKGKNGVVEIIMKK